MQIELIWKPKNTTIISHDIVMAMQPAVRIINGYRWVMSDWVRTTVAHEVERAVDGNNTPVV